MLSGGSLSNERDHPQIANFNTRQSTAVFVEQALLIRGRIHFIASRKDVYLIGKS